MIFDDTSNLSEDFKKRISRYTQKFYEQKNYGNGIGIGNMQGMNIMGGPNGNIGNQGSNNIMNNNMNNFTQSNHMNNFNPSNNPSLVNPNQLNYNSNNNLGANNYYHMMNQNPNNLNNLNKNLSNNFNNFINQNQGQNIPLNSGSMNNMNNMHNSKTPNGMQNNLNYANRKGSRSSLAEEKEDKKLGGLQGQNGKYTCRFEILIENDKDFQVARRLIGAKVGD